MWFYDYFLWSENSVRFEILFRMTKFCEILSHSVRYGMYENQSVTELWSIFQTFLVLCLFFFKIKILSRIPSKLPRVWIRIMPDNFLRAWSGSKLFAKVISWQEFKNTFNQKQLRNLVKGIKLTFYPNSKVLLKTNFVKRCEYFLILQQF